MVDPLVVKRKLPPSAGARNTIVHEYETIDDVIVHESISQALQLYKQYVVSVMKYIERGR